MVFSDFLLALVNGILLTFAILLLIPGVMLFIECIASLIPLPRRTAKQVSRHPNLAVLVPAHNEEAGISTTINNLLQELSPQDQLVVVADNCSDNTAAIARQLGATVIERHDPEHRGKGYALDFGVQFLAKQPPDVVVIVDADCWVKSGSILQIAKLAMTKNRPVQATYLIDVPEKLSPKNAVSILAFTVKNLVRPVGLARLNLPCLLTGTGMAFPWKVLSNSPLASGNIVEDMKLGLDLAIAGFSPVFCAEALVTSIPPQKDQSAKSQRTRWEHGHLQTMLTQVPRLLKAFLQTFNIHLLALALDLLIPPLSLLVIAWFVLTLLALLGIWAGASLLPGVLLGTNGVLIVTAILMAWAKYCRKTLPVQVLLSVPLYIIWKFPLYFAFLFNRQKAWVRTERDTPQNSSEANS